MSVGIWVIHRGAKSGGSELVKVKEFFCMKAATDIILSLKEDISFVESYALVMYACLLI